jgi:hypothetical protein
MASIVIRLVEGYLGLFKKNMEDYEVIIFLNVIRLFSDKLLKNK